MQTRDGDPHPALAENPHLQRGWGQGGGQRSILERGSIFNPSLSPLQEISPSPLPRP